MESTPTLHVVNRDHVVTSVVTRMMEGIGIRTHDYTTPGQLLAALPLASPACLLIDLVLPEMSALQLLERLRRRGAFHPCIFTSHRAEPETLVALMRRGAHDFVKKPFNQLELLERVQGALALDTALGPLTAAAWEMRKALAGLSRREREIMTLIGQGHTAEQVAERLHISRRTVESHRNTGFKKLGISRSAEVARRMAVLDTLSSVGLFSGVE